MGLHTCKLLVPLVWWFLITSSSSPVLCILTDTKQGILCQEIERQALLTLKVGLSDEGGRLSSWSIDNPNCCNWKGVSCSNHTGHVLKLNLRNPFQYFEDEYQMFSLKGEVRSSLLELKYLEYLDLSRNDFESSKIPSFLSSLENLRYLNLSSSYFSGIVPAHLGNLSSLQYLDLGGNWGLEVESLQWFTGLSSLKHLNLDQVNLEKAGPDWLKAFDMLPSLLQLHLSGCELSSLPVSFNHSINLTSLSTLDLSDNDFKSSLTMPPWLFNLTDLVNVRFHWCYLQTGIPDEIGKLVKLQQLDLSGNAIRGQLLASLGNLSNLVMLNLEENYGIEGGIPATFGHLCKLQILSLHLNKLEGEINEFIDGLARCSKNHLDSLDLSYNSLWGSIPTTIRSLISLKTLYISYNQMNGTISGSIGQLSELEIMDLSYGNHWQGFLTETHFEKHTKLQRLQVTTTSKLGSLVMNVTQDWLPPFRTSLLKLQLDGAKMSSNKFPRWTQNLSQLEYLSLQDWGPSDSIPIEFWISCSNITRLYLSNNAISISKSFKNLESPLPRVPAGKLTHLYLANNSYGGENEIPSSIAQLAPALVQLDLSSSSISGEIPRSICQLSNLTYLFLMDNVLTGELTHHRWEQMESLMVFDVSNNRLVGNIPESLCSLSRLYSLLLSDNNLRGEIPSFIRSSILQLLDLGGNKLTGNIPPSLAKNNTMLLLLSRDGNGSDLDRRLRGNMLSGTIPPEICLLSRLQTLYLAHNNLQGMIPKCLGHLSVSDNNDIYLTESIALVTKGREYTFGSLILKLVHLVDLSGNNLSGNIPGSLMNLTVMQSLNLSMNNLTGDIPSNIGELRMLESLDLSRNRLSGTIPQSLSALSFLSALNLSQNNLSGKIPLAGAQLQTLNNSSRYEGNPLLCGPPLLTICPGNEPTKENEKHGKSGFDLEEWEFILSLVLGFFVGFWGVCGSLVIKASWRETYFEYLAGIEDKIIGTVVNVARLERKMGDVRMAT